MEVVCVATARRGLLAAACVVSMAETIACCCKQCICLGVICQTVRLASRIKLRHVRWAGLPTVRDGVGQQARRGEEFRVAILQRKEQHDLPFRRQRQFREEGMLRDARYETDVRHHPESQSKAKYLSRMRSQELRLVERPARAKAQFELQLMLKWYPF